MGPWSMSLRSAQLRFATYSGRGFALQGGLMSYGRDFADQIRIATSLVGQISMVPYRLERDNQRENSYCLTR
jgi:hypothetical protein